MMTIIIASGDGAVDVEIENEIGSRPGDGNLFRPPDLTCRTQAVENNTTTETTCKKNFHAAEHARDDG